MSTANTHQHTQGQPSLRPFRHSDLEYFNNYGCSARGITGEKDGKPILFAGILLSEPLQAFSVLSEDARKHPKLIVKAIRQFKTLVQSMSAPVYAIADEKEPNSEKVLVMAGFKKKYGRTYATGGF